ncbi:hypothetical protein B0A48_04215 [Cryoendolithus antarcticus]|uniref:t-SNARE coiled-coil homology domain-containing protein n=1 Tax=Cryoendolithus antarcticus TaxID=1507870 RepID=A0A1V8TEQ1_9PEZI|nr:hypothetical protein B0A48_04215 [Cryoendolithus antarcticus]
MSGYNQYSGYGGNPYGGEAQGGYGGGSGAGTGAGAGAGGYGSSNPYGSENPYGGGYGSTAQQPATGLQAPPLAHQASTYSQQTEASTYSSPQHDVPFAGQNAPPVPAVPQGHTEYVQPSSTVLSNPDFLSRVEAVKADIRTLTTHVSQIASLHQQQLSSADSGSASRSLESMVTQTQVLNTSIKDQIKFLETDAARSKGNQVKDTQIRQLKGSFTKQLQEFRQEEASYEKRYREQIARQYRIVNPEASEGEVNEAVNADWGNEGVFQTALKSNRSATANTVLGAVRARHNDIQKIERTMLELQQLMEDLASTIVLQDAPIQQIEQHTENVKHDTEAGNVQLDKGITSAKRARKLKWWCFFICVAIVCILALVLGLYFGLNAKK